MNVAIKILGTGCKKCERLKQLTEEVISENNITATIEKVEDLEKIMEYEVMNTPALVVNNKVVIAGRVPSQKEILDSILTEKSTDKDTLDSILTEKSTDKDTATSCCCGGNC